MNKGIKYLLILLTLSCLLIWIGILTFPTDRLRIIACDVGQGDAILITKGEVQVLVDGGPGNAVSKCLEDYVPFWDRSIEVVILTHPEQDHLGGLVEVFSRYKVNLFIANAVDNNTEDFTEIKRLVKEYNTRVVNPTSNTLITLGEVKLDFVWPASSLAANEGTEVPNVLGAFTTKDNLNDYSVVFNLHYGEFDALFTGDIGPEVIDEVLSTGEISDTEYLKVPHHGSKNGLTRSLFDASSPEISVISVGKKNRYGHPNAEVLEILSREGNKVLRTDIQQEVIVETDGLEWWVN